MMERPSLRKDRHDDPDDEYAGMTKEEIRQAKLYQRWVRRRVYYRLPYREVAEKLAAASDFITFPEHSVYHIPEDELATLIEEHRQGGMTTYERQIEFAYFGADGSITAIGRSHQASEMLYSNTMFWDAEWKPISIASPESFERLTEIIDSVLKEYEFEP